MKLHWHPGHGNRLACGRLAYATAKRGIYTTPRDSLLECADEPKNVTCDLCQKVMMINKYERA